MFEETEECGVTFDHDLSVLDERDGYTTEVCRRCDAEIITPSDC